MQQKAILPPLPKRSTLGLCVSPPRRILHGHQPRSLPPWWTTRHLPCSQDIRLREMLYQRKHGNGKTGGGPMVRCVDNGADAEHGLHVLQDLWETVDCGHWRPGWDLWQRWAGSDYGEVNGGTCQLLLRLSRIVGPLERLLAQHCRFRPRLVAGKTSGLKRLDLRKDIQSKKIHLPGNIGWQTRRLNHSTAVDLFPFSFWCALTALWFRCQRLTITKRWKATEDYDLPIRTFRPVHRGSWCITKHSHQRHDVARAKVSKLMLITYRQGALWHALVVPNGILLWLSECSCAGCPRYTTVKRKCMKTDSKTDNW